MDRLARRVQGGDPWATRIVTAGFLLRAVAGVALFWISYLRLPVMLSHSLGGGLLGLRLGFDALHAAGALSGEAGPVRSRHPRSGGLPSVSFLQILCLAQTLFGYVTSVGLLLNCACFLGGALLLVRWSASLGPAGRYPGLLALTVLSLHPSWILWSTQPLKEPLLGLLVIAWFCASRHWLDNSVKPGAGWRRVLWALALAAVIYELAGIRAYFALILWLAFGAGLVLSLLQASPVRRWRRTVVSASLWILLSQVVVWSGGPLLPPAVRAILMPYEPGGEVEVGAIGEQTKRVLLRPLGALREGFVSSGGASQISGAAEEGRQAVRGGPPATLPVVPPTPTEEWSSNLLTGLAATFLPRAVGRSLGLFSIGPGRGAWAFVELDTLFRLREMILMPLSLAPLAATLGSERERETAARAPE